MAELSGKPAWVAVDWGTTHLRLWLMGDDGQLLDQRASDAGMGRLAPSEFEPALLALLGDDLTGPLTVVCCGMVGAAQGWVEAPYANVPCPPPGITQATRASCRDPRLSVHILPGISQTTPPDVMRGEETQIAGFLSQTPGFDGVICLPGTHTKWVHVSAGEVISFRTFMTGELFGLISGSSVLRHSIGPTGWDDAAFETALSDAMSRPAALTAEMFSIRAASLLKGTPPEASRARLSGLLIGAELAAARVYWLGQSVRIIGEDSLADAYRLGLQLQAAEVQVVSSDQITLTGLRAAYKNLTEATG